MSVGPRDGEGSVWDRLRRRKVVQWVAAYAAAAWGLLQGLQFLAEAFEWSSRVLQLGTVAALVGLPIVLVLAWYHGDRGEQHVSRVELSLLTLLFLLGGGLIWRYHQAAESPAVTDASRAEENAPDAADTGPSIAVLPFDNRSANAGDAFFVDGIHDDILTQLSKVSALKVISRTSVERFRDTKLPIREIARQLGVRAVLEGGVQRGGERVRINVQLIDAGSETHLWAETYDRELTASNLFEVQSEVAHAIAAALHAALTPAERARLAAIPTESLAAWEAYQNGRRNLAKRTVASLTEAAADFRESIERDPRFALAYAGLADATWLAADFRGLPMEPAMAKAEDLIGQALRLDPNLAEARVTLAKFAEVRGEFERAESLYREAIALNPSYPQAYHWQSQLLGRMGRDDEARRSLRRAAELDPMSVSLQAVLAWSLSGDGLFDESLQGFEKAGRMDPSSPLPYNGSGAILATGYGRLDQAAPYLERALEIDSTSYAVIEKLAGLYLDLGDQANFQRVLEHATANRVARPLAGAYMDLYQGEHASALAGAVESLEIYSTNPQALRLLRDADLRNGDAGSARARYERAFPELLQRGPRRIDWSNLAAAVDLAFVLLSLGERDRATELIEEVDAQVARTPRLGPWGYHVADAATLAMRGRSRDALVALRSAERAGWHGPYWRYYRDFDPALASIRGEPEFKAVFADIERELARQRRELATRPGDAPLDLHVPNR